MISRKARSGRTPPASPRLHGRVREIAEQAVDAEPVEGLVFGGGIALEIGREAARLAAERPCVHEQPERMRVAHYVRRRHDDAVAFVDAPVRVQIVRLAIAVAVDLARGED